MAYRSILVQSEPGEHAVSRIKCAAALADRFQAGVIGIAAECINPAMAAEPYNAYAAEWVTAMADEAEANLRAAEEVFRREGGPNRIGWSTRRIMPARALAEASRAADLIVVGGARSHDRGPYLSADVPELLIVSGRPVLIAPPGGDYCAAKKVLIAWKDSRESRRATTDAIPFLQKAEEVVVLETCESSDMSAAQERTAEVVAALARHEVNARGEVAIAKPDEVAAALMEQADWRGADLIVAGAYGHSRLGEWVFGGVTRGLLHQTQRFVLFSH